MIHQTPRVLIIEKEEGTPLVQFKDIEGFELHMSNDIMEVFTMISKINPDLIILDAISDELSGYEVLKRLKGFHKTEKIPVVLVADITEDVDPCEALEEGAIDFIIKPISANLLKVKMRNYVNMYNALLMLEDFAQFAKEMNPNTGLPGNNAIREKVISALEHEDPYVVVYADLDNFKAYNDIYGFAKGDEIIKLTAEIIQDSLNLTKKETFLGHIGGDDFVFLAPYDDITKITDNIIETFDTKILDFYQQEDVEKGYIISKGRRGEIQKFPISSISLAGVKLEQHNENTRYERIVDICSEVKKYAKKFEKSCFYMDRRGGK